MPRVGLSGKTVIRYTEKWLALGVVIGLISGLASYMFFYLIGFFESLVLYIANGSYTALSGFKDISTMALGELSKPYTIPLLSVFGIALGSLITYVFAPETEGSGVDSTIRSYHRDMGKVRYRVPIIKALSSALSIGFGASAGLQGPAIQIGSSLGSIVSRILRLTPEDRRIAFVAGMAGGLSTLFRSPLGAAFFAVEVLYKRDLEVKAFIPAYISSLVAFTVTAPLFGYSYILPSLQVDPEKLFRFDSIVSYVLLALYIAPFTYLFIAVYTSLRRFFNDLAKQLRFRALKPIVGAVIVSPIIFVAPYIAGSGMGLLTLILRGDVSFLIPHGDLNFIGYNSILLSLILVVTALSKVIATSITIGSGVSGGLFMPSLLAGSMLGLSYYYLVGSHISQLSPEIYAYLGMACFMAGAAKVPLAVSIMAGEMGDNYLMIAPALVTSLLVREFSGEASIYSWQLTSRVREEVIKALNILERISGSRIYSSITARDLSQRIEGIKICGGADVGDLQNIERTVLEYGFAPLIDSGGRPCGIIDVSNIDYVIDSLEKGSGVERLLTFIRRDIPVVKHDRGVGDVVSVILEREVPYVFIVDDEGRYVGTVVLDDLYFRLLDILLRMQSGRES